MEDSKKFLKSLVVLFVEDDEQIRKELSSVFENFFRKVYTATNGEEGLELFKKLYDNEEEPLDIIITDVNMPKMTGLEMSKEIRAISDEIPIILQTAYSDTQFLLEAIKIHINHYAMKPINIKELLSAVKKFATIYRQSRVIKLQQKQMDAYISAVDKVAIVSQTDTKGKIVWVNDIFCEVSGYSKEELIGQHHNIIRHPDVAKEVFAEMWNTIRAGQTWHGRIKNRAKDGSAYYTDATIIPIFDSNSKITGYYGIRFLITKEIEEQRKLKQFFMSERNKLIKKHQAEIIPLKAEIIKLKKQLQQQSGSQDIVNELNTRLQKTTQKVAQLTNQIKHYEAQNKELSKKAEEVSANARAKLDDVIRKLNLVKEEKEKLERTVINMQENLKDKTKVIDTLQQSLQSRIDRIKDLEDLLKFREKEIEELKSQK